MLEEYIYGIDFGGSGPRIWKINLENGRLIKKVLSLPAEKINSNEELTSIILNCIEKGAKVGVGAAGDVDEKNLIIKYSPNFPIKEKITFPRDLAREGRNVTLTNDMRAAVQAVVRYEPFVKNSKRKIRNIAVATYSSGFNAAVARDDEIVTQAEFGHIIYKKNSELFCGCGRKGHYEIFVSGNGAASIAKQYFSITQDINHPIIKEALKDYNKEAKKENKPTYKPEDLENRIAYLIVFNSISSKHIYEACRKYPNQDPQKSIRNTQIEAIADSFGLINSSYNPLDLIVCMGSQTKDADILFEPAIKKYRSREFKGQLPGLKKPEVIITQLPEIGAQGAAAYFLYVKSK